MKIRKLETTFLATALGLGAPAALSAQDTIDPGGPPNTGETGDPGTSEDDVLDAARRQAEQAQQQSEQATEEAEDAVDPVQDPEDDTFDTERPGEQFGQDFDAETESDDAVDDAFDTGGSTDPSGLDSDRGAMP